VHIDRPEEQVARIWAGTDIGKSHHHCVVLDAEGRRLLSRRVLNDEPEVLALLADVLALDEDVVWAAASTNASAPKASGPPRPSSPWPADASTSCGP
jgi:hypothetical protein